MHERGIDKQHGKPRRWEHVTLNKTSVRSRLGRLVVAERPVVVKTPGNAGRAKGPWFKDNMRSGVRAGRLA